MDWGHLGYLDMDGRAHQILRELHLEIGRFYAQSELSDALIGLRHGIQTALVVLLAAAVFAGPYVVASPTLSSIFTLSKQQISLIIPIYGFFASVLPVWLLLSPILLRPYVW